MTHRYCPAFVVRTALASLLGILIARTAEASTPGELYVSNFNAGRVDRYDTVDGLISGPRVVGFATGLSTPTGVVVSGGLMFVENYGPGTISLYNATNGQLLNASFITGLDHPWGLAISGTTLYVTNVASGGSTGSIGAYATSGATINASLVTGLSSPHGVVVGGTISGNTKALYVTHAFDGGGHQGVAEYNTDGGTVNASFITDQHDPEGLALSGTNLFISNNGDGTVYEYNTNGVNLSFNVTNGGASTPQALAADDLGLNLYVANTAANPSGFVDDFSLPGGTLVASPGAGSMDSPSGLFYIPEPSTGAALVMGVACLLGRRRRRAGS
jgi:hypothetical protein